MQFEEAAALQQSLANLEAAQMVGTEVAGVLQAPRVVCLAMLDRRAEAQLALHELRILWRIDRPDNEGPIGPLIGLCEAAVVLEERSLAATLIPQLDRLAGALGTWGFNMVSIGRLLGDAAALLGQPDKARGYYHQALEVCAKVRHRPETALTRLGLAELLLEEAEKPEPFGKPPLPFAIAQAVPPSPQGAREAVPSPARGEGQGEGEDPVTLRREALEHLDFAIAEFREMKMQPSQEQTLRHKELLKA